MQQLCPVNESRRLISFYVQTRSLHEITQLFSTQQGYTIIKYRMYENNPLIFLVVDVKNCSFIKIIKSFKKFFILINIIISINFYYNLLYNFYKIIYIINYERKL